jgi:hypothetical protein
MPLILKPASASRPSGTWNDDDFDAVADGAVVGRILKVHAAPVGTPCWTALNVALFSERDLGDLVREQIGRAHNEVARKDADELLNMPVEDQVDIIVSHFQLILPTLREDLAHSDDPQETTLRITDYGRQISVEATTYQIRIPFDGHQGLFRHSPATRPLVPPFAEVDHQELIISLVGYNVTAQDLNQEIDKTVSSIKAILGVATPTGGRMQQGDTGERP